MMLGRALAAAARAAAPTVRPAACARSAFARTAAAAARAEPAAASQVRAQLLARLRARQQPGGARAYATKTAAVSASSASSGVQEVVDSWRVNLRFDDAHLRGARGDAWYTGKRPVHGECPGVSEAGVITALPTPNTATATRRELRDYFDNTWASTEVLFAALQGAEPFYRPPYHALRHPKIFYYAHPAVLYVNKFRIAGLLDAPINEYYEHIFATGVDEMQWDDLSKNDMLWPSVDEVTAYRRQVYEAVVDVIESHPAFETLAENHASPFWAVLMGTEHERIHLETSSVLMRELPLALVRQPEAWPAPHPVSARAAASCEAAVEGVDFPANPFVPVEAGPVRLGKERAFPSYGWDNEYGERDMYVKSFAATRQLVSNGEYMQFVRDEGYLRAELWEPEGWAWRCFRNVKHPTFWVPAGPAGLHQYRLRTCFSEIALPPDWPVCVNYHEARAFANWRSARDDPEAVGPGYRLMTEPEHHRIRDTSPDALRTDPALDPPMRLDGPGMARELGLNLNLAHGSEGAVDAGAPNRAGFHDAFGNVWQWMEDHMSALPGFRVDPLYDDFTLPCFDGEHHLILGGSFASTGDEASHFARFHFRPHFHQHAGFRLVAPNQASPELITSCMDNQGPHVGQNPFRSTGDAARKHRRDAALAQWLYAHFNDADDAFLPPDARDYPRRLIDHLRAHARAAGAATGRVIDIGCSVGGMAHELARDYDEVIGIDVSAGAIRAGTAILDSHYAYSVQSQGGLVHEAVARPRVVPEAAERVTLKQADAMCLAPDLGAFDAVVVSNVLDRLPSPQTLLGRLGGPRGIVRPGGLLLVACPYSWSEEYTPADLWLGANPNADGACLTSEAALAKFLEPNFALLDETNMPLALRTHDRQAEYLNTQVTVWQHKA